MIQASKKRTVGLSGQGLRALSYAQFRKKEFLRSGDLVAGLGLTRSQERQLLSRLAAKKQIVRLKRDVYYVSPVLSPSGIVSLSEHFILSKLMQHEASDHQVSGPNAFHLYGFDDQVPNRFYVYNDRISGVRIIGGHTFEFIKANKARLEGSSRKTAPDGARIVMASKAKALVDAIYDWSRFNTLPRAFAWIVSELRKDPRFKREFLCLAVRCGNKSALRRIGCLLEQNGVPRRNLRAIKAAIGDSKSVIPLVPRRLKRGHVDSYWGVVINERVKY